MKTFIFYEDNSGGGNSHIILATDFEDAKNRISRLAPYSRDEFVNAKQYFTLKDLYDSNYGVLCTDDLKPDEAFSTSWDQ